MIRSIQKSHWTSTVRGLPSSSSSSSSASRIKNFSSFRFFMDHHHHKKNKTQNRNFSKQQQQEEEEQILSYSQIIDVFKEQGIIQTPQVFQSFQAINILPFEQSQTKLLSTTTTAESKSSAAPSSTTPDSSSSPSSKDQNQSELQELSVNFFHTCITTVEAVASKLLSPSPSPKKVLDIGCGVGYLSCVLAAMLLQKPSLSASSSSSSSSATKEPQSKVFAMDIDETTVKIAAENMFELGTYERDEHGRPLPAAQLSTVKRLPDILEFYVGNGLAGFREQQPFDVITVGGYVRNQVPKDLIDQLAPGGVMVIPVAVDHQPKKTTTSTNMKKNQQQEQEDQEKQLLMRIEKLPNGRINQKVLRTVVFEPLLDEIEQEEEIEEEKEEN